jgi:hypothetical protein
MSRQTKYQAGLRARGLCVRCRRPSRLAVCRECRPRKAAAQVSAARRASALKRWAKMSHKTKIQILRQAARWRKVRPARLGRCVAALFAQAAASGRAQDHAFARRAADAAAQFVRR